MFKKMFKACMLFGTGLVFIGAAQANEKTGGYKIDLCIPSDGEYLSEESRKYKFNACSKQAQGLYDKVLKTSKVNFNKKYVLVEVKYPAIDEKTGKPTNFTFFNYIAIDPKTKKGYTFPYDVYNEGGASSSPRFNFKISSNSFCTTKPNVTVSNEGGHTAYTSYEDEPVCFKLNTSGKDISWDYVSSYN